MDKLEALKKTFGHSAFRPGQETLIDAILAGRDALGIMPTGAGKSVCYQVPALLLPGITLVVSPLIALMKDQVAALREAGVAAAYLNSSLTPRQFQTALGRAWEGRYQIIYVAPERLDTEGFLRFAQQAPIRLVAVDEAHCVSQWGQDFRPSYLKIADFIAALPARPAVGAFTATATQAVKADIQALLRLREPVTVATGFDRPNLYFEVVRPRDKQKWAGAYVAAHPEQSGIIYCATRTNVEKVCDALCRQGVAAARYHAGLADGERRRSQEDFLYDRARVMVATNAFGMGIDKSNVSYVLHYNMPKNLEGYYQEAGRAGRDGSPAQCVLLYAPADVVTAKLLIENTQENEALPPKERQAARQRDYERLEQMAGYSKTTGCLREYLLAYFGEGRGNPCGNCANCRAAYQTQDATPQARLLLEAVAQVRRRYPWGLGAAVILRLLRGSRDQRIRQLGLDTLPGYGALAAMSRESLQELMDQCLEKGLLEAETGPYPVLRLGQGAQAVLQGGEAVTLRVREVKASAPDAKNEKTVFVPEEGGLYAHLKALRGRLARQAGVPAYVVFTNAALADMARRRPATPGEFMAVSGVGEAKARRYGEPFMAAIREYEGKE